MKIQKKSPKNIMGLFMKIYIFRLFYSLGVQGLDGIYMYHLMFGLSTLSVRLCTTNFLLQFISSSTIVHADEL